MERTDQITQLKQFLRGASEAPPLAHQRWLGSFSGPELARLLAVGDVHDVEAEHLGRAAGLAPGADPLTCSLALYQDTYLYVARVLRLRREYLRQEQAELAHRS